MDRDRFFSPPAALQFGLIDEVIEQRPLDTVEGGGRGGRGAAASAATTPQQPR